MKKLAAVLLAFLLLPHLLSCSGGAETVKPPSGACLSRTVKLALIPFKNASADETTNWFGIAAYDAIASGLRNICGVSLLDEKYTNPYTDKVGAIKAEEQFEGGFDPFKDMKIDAVVFGHYSLQPSGVKITISIVEMKTGMAIYSNTLENHIVQISRLFETAGRDIIEGINTRMLLPKGKNIVVINKQLPVPQIKSFDSFAAYGKCLYNLNKYELEKAIEECDRSAQLDPNFWQAKIAISRAHIANEQPMKTKRWLADGAAGARQAGDAYKMGLAQILSSRLTYSVNQIKENTDLLSRAIAVYRFAALDLPLAEALLNMADRYGRVAFLDQVDKHLRAEWVKKSEVMIAEAKIILSKNKDYFLEAYLHEVESLFNKGEAKTNSLKAAVGAAEKAVASGASRGEGPVILLRQYLLLAENLIEIGAKEEAAIVLGEAEKAVMNYKIPQFGAVSPMDKVSRLQAKIRQ